MLIKNKFKELFGIDLRSLALFRVCLALLLIIDLLQRIPNLKLFYSDDGIIPRTTIINEYSNPFNISIHLSNGTVCFQFILILIALVFAFALLVGYRTKLVTFICWFLTLSLHVRNPIVLIGGDELFRMMFFWSMFLPLGAHYSIDNALNSSTNKTPQQIISFGTFALLAQVLILYWVSIVFKAKAPEWLDGRAVYFALTQDHYAHILTPYIINNFQLLKFATHFTYWYEILAPAILFTPICTGPIRTITAISFFFFQIGLGLCIDLSIFPWASTIAIIPYLPAWFWDKLEKLFKTEVVLDLKIYCNPSVGYCKKFLSIFLELACIRKVQFLPLTETNQSNSINPLNNLWYLTDSQGITFTNITAIQELLKYSCLLKPLYLLTTNNKISPLMSEIYEYFSRQKHCLYRTSSSLRFRPIKTNSTPLGNLLALLFLVYVITWNFGTFDRKIYVPPGLQFIAHLLRLNQSWSLYSPLAKVGYWYAMPAKLNDGSEVDLFTYGKESQWTKLVKSKTLYNNRHWQSILLHVAWYDKAKYTYLPKIAWYLCKEWNEDHMQDKQINHLDIYLISKLQYDNYKHAEPVKILLWKYDVEK